MKVYKAIIFTNKPRANRCCAYPPCSLEMILEVERGSRFTVVKTGHDSARMPDSSAARPGKRGTGNLTGWEEHSVGSDSQSFHLKASSFEKLPRRGHAWRETVHTLSPTTSHTFLVLRLVRHPPPFNDTTSCSTISKASLKGSRAS